MRRDDLYLNDVIDAVDHTAQIIAGFDFDRFQESELVRSGVVRKLANIGEAAARISEELRRRHPQVPWPQIVAFRNILIRVYFGIDWSEVWNYTRPQFRISVTQISQGSARGVIAPVSDRRISLGCGLMASHVCHPSPRRRRCFPSNSSAEQSACRR